MKKLSLWQRRHQPDVIGEVTPIAGIGTWAVCAYRTPGRRQVRHGGRFELLTEAHHAADALVAAAFHHTCGTACAAWQPIERRRAGSRSFTRKPRRRLTDVKKEA
jgi:hypothetical protein